MFMVTYRTHYIENKKLVAPALFIPTESESAGLGPSSSEKGVTSNQHAQEVLCRRDDPELSLTGRP